MKDIDEINELLRPLARIRPDEPGGRAGGTRAQALFTDIVAQGRETMTARAPRRLRGPYRGRRTLLGLAASATLALGVVFGPSLLGHGGGTAISYANSAVEIREEGDVYAARIKDPYADQRRFSEAFRALGLNVELKVIPVSPASVGEIVSSGMSGNLGSGIENVPFGARKEPAGCDLADSGCFLTVTVPAAIKGMSGAMHFDLGRPARPGESYANEWQPATRAGEQLAGAKVSGRTVDDVLAEVRKRGLIAEFGLVSIHQDNGYEVKPLAADQVGADWIVYQVTSVRAGVVRLEVTTERHPALKYMED